MSMVNIALYTILGYYRDWEREGRDEVHRTVKW